MRPPFNSDGFLSMDDAETPAAAPAGTPAAPSGPIREVQWRWEPRVLDRTAADLAERADAAAEVEPAVRQALRLTAGAAPTQLESGAGSATAEPAACWSRAGRPSDWWR